jgi:hypothetical protein
MKKVSVSLLMTSASMSLGELSSRLGRLPSLGSNSKGDTHSGARAGKDPWSETIWRFDSDADETASIEDHLERLEIQFPAAELKQALPPDCNVWVDIALFFDSAYVSASLSRRAMQIVDSYDAQLEITCYPSKFDEQG